MIREFSKYKDIEKKGINGELVTYNLVEHDHPLQNVEQLFGCQNTNVEYCISLNEAIDKIKINTKELMFYPTQIPVCTKEKTKVHNQGTHSVVLAATNHSGQKNIYFFDPNGFYNYKTHNILYNMGGACNSTDVWVNKLEPEIGQINYLSVSGPQYFYEETSSDNGYILNGGYCMFFNYRFIEYFKDDFRLLQNFYNMANTCKNDECLKKFYMNYFPLKNMGYYTYTIIERIIQNCPIENDITKYKPLPHITVSKKIAKQPLPIGSYGPIRSGTRVSSRVKHNPLKFSKRKKSVRKSRRRRSTSKKSVRKSRRRRY